MYMYSYPIMGPLDVRFVSPSVWAILWLSPKRHSGTFTAKLSQLVKLFGFLYFQNFWKNHVEYRNPNNLTSWLNLAVKVPECLFGDNQRIAHTKGLTNLTSSGPMIRKEWNCSTITTHKPCIVNPQAGWTWIKVFVITKNGQNPYVHAWMVTPIVTHFDTSWHQKLSFMYKHMGFDQSSWWQILWSKFSLLGG